MCFARQPKQQATPIPAPAPAAPSPVAEEQKVADPRRAEDEANFGTDTPSLRVDRSLSSGGVGVGGAGLRM